VGGKKSCPSGVRPSQVNPRAIQVMAELGIDISQQRAKSVNDLTQEHFDLVITLCDQAAQQCPMFPGETEVRHVGFPDPAKVTGTEAKILAAFREVRDALRRELVPLLEARRKQRPA
jgi:arsenate reductase (thioredoxin)